MPIKAFVLAQTEPQRTKEVVGKLPKPAYFTMGRWDTLSQITGETPRAVADQVIDQVRRLEGIRRTETLPILTELVKPTRPTPPIKAFVFFNTEAAKTNQVFGALATLREVQEVYTVAGRYDIIATVGVNTWDEWIESVLNCIRKIDGISSTETALLV